VKIKYLFAAGGTAGHINPAIAIAGAIRDIEHNSEILFVGNENSMEQRLVPLAGFEFKSIKISGFKRSFSPKAAIENIKTIKRIFTSSIQSKKIIREFKPDICIGTGGYVSGPVVRTAVKMKIPAVIHEQNAYPGVTTKMLSKSVKAVMLAIEEAKNHLKSSCNFIVTGNPVRKEVISSSKENARAILNLDSRPVILSYGGSLGARRINEVMASLISRSGMDNQYQHIHAYGQYGKWFPDLVLQKGTDISMCGNLDVREYINDMPVCLAAADLVICRAGAITISELQVTHKPAILIPSPNVAENHQYHNAMALVKAGAAEIIEEKDLTDQLLIKKVDNLLTNKEKLKSLEKNLKSMAVYDANERIFAAIKSAYYNS